MPSLEEELRRYGDVLDDVAGGSGEPDELTTVAGTRRATRTALVAVAVVVVVSLIALASTARSTRKPSPATSPVVSPTTATTTDAAEARQAEARGAAAAAAARHARVDAEAAAWIAACLPFASAGSPGLDSSPSVILKTTPAML